MSEIIPAATLVVFREQTGGPPELLLVERASHMRFAAGAVVFPGGRVDLADRVFGASLPGDTEDNAARIAAIRETIEETGLSIGITPEPTHGGAASLRRHLAAGATLDAALAGTGRIDTEALTPFARWCPDHAGIRRFDTRFYLAALPAGAAATSVDATENVRLFWSTAAALLREADAGRTSLIYPTRRNLERLAQFDSVAAAVADARRHPVTTITPHHERRSGVDHLCIPEGLGYPVTAEPLSAVRRG